MTRNPEELPDLSSALPSAAQVLGAGVRSSSARRQYLFGMLPDAQLSEQDFDRLAASVSHESQTRVIKDLKAPAKAVASEASPPRPSRTLVIETTADVAERLHQSCNGDSAWHGLVIEFDAPLTFGGTVRSIRIPSVLGPAVVPTAIRLRLVGRNDDPITGAVVTAVGNSGPVHGLTDTQGNVELTLFDEYTPAQVEALYVRPRADYWSYWVKQPVVDPTQPATVRLASLDQAFPQFPAQPLTGWGLKAIRLDLLPADQFDGRGVRVALVGSGCQTGHRNLRHVVDGFDLSSSNQAGWKTDDVGFGTHCAGIIGAANVGSGIRGIAPAAQLITIKTTGSRVSDLVAALDDCIARDVDIVCLPLGTDQPSALLDARIRQARQLGIACIAAAGDSGGSVSFPASMASVLAVAAIGWRAAFPSDSLHTLSICEAGGTADGYFAAKFSSSGSAVDVCGPGVAVVSSVPPDNFAAWDGTGLAAAHVAGLAALVLAHRSDFQSGGVCAGRGAYRVERLFDIIRSSASPFQIDDTDHSGFGLPDAPRALDATSIAGAADRPEDVNLHSLRSLVEAVHRSRTNHPTAVMEEALSRAGLQVAM